MRPVEIQVFVEGERHPYRVRFEAGRAVGVTQDGKALWSDGGPLMPLARVIIREAIGRLMVYHVAPGQIGGWLEPGWYVVGREGEGPHDTRELAQAAALRGEQALPRPGLSLVPDTGTRRKIMPANQQMKQGIEQLKQAVQRLRQAKDDPDQIEQIAQQLQQQVQQLEQQANQG